MAADGDERREYSAIRKVVGDMNNNMQHSSALKHNNYDVEHQTYPVKALLEPSPPQPIAAQLLRRGAARTC